MKEDCVIWPEIDRPLRIVQQKPQNDKRARRCYRCDPLGHVRQHAPVADLVLPCLASLLELQDVATLGSETSGIDFRFVAERLRLWPQAYRNRNRNWLIASTTSLGGQMRRAPIRITLQFAREIGQFLSELLDDTLRILGMFSHAIDQGTTDDHSVGDPAYQSHVLSCGDTKPDNDR